MDLFLKTFNRTLSFAGEMKIVLNTGPIIGLGKIGLFFLLNQLASEVIIPPTVHRLLSSPVVTAIIIK